MERSTLWNVVPIYCENVIIRGITVNSTEVPSGDGIDIESCKNVLIEYCTLNCGDDCFTLKAGRADDGLRVGKATENVVIRHSLAQHGHGGITIGSETAGMIKTFMFTTACSTAQEQEYALRPAVIVGEAPIIPFTNVFA